MSDFQSVCYKYKFKKPGSGTHLPRSSKFGLGKSEIQLRSTQTHSTAKTRKGDPLRVLAKIFNLHTQLVKQIRSNALLKLRTDRLFSSRFAISQASLLTDSNSKSNLCDQAFGVPGTTAGLYLLNVREGLSRIPELSRIPKYTDAK